MRMFRANEEQFQGLDYLVKLRDSIPRAIIHPLPDSFKHKNSHLFRYIDVEGKDGLASFVSNRYTLVQNSEVIERAINFLASHGLEDIHGSVIEKFPRLYIRTQFPKMVVEAGPKDAIEMGMTFMNSYDGTTSVGASVDMLRLVCTNGLTRWQRLVSGIHKHKGIIGIESLYNKAWDILNTEYASIGERIKLMQETEVTDLSKAIERLGFGERVSESILGKVSAQAFADKRTPTAYDIWNGVTAYRSHELRDKETNAPNPLTQAIYDRVANRVLDNPLMLVAPIQAQA